MESSGSLTKKRARKPNYTDLEISTLLEEIMMERATLFSSERYSITRFGRQTLRDWGRGAVSSVSGSCTGACMFTTRCGGYTGYGGNFGTDLSGHWFQFKGTRGDRDKHFQTARQ